MWIKIGSKSINMGAVVHVVWEPHEANTINVYAQGMDFAVILRGEEIEQFKTAFDTLMDLETFVLQTQAQLQQQAQMIQAELVEKKNQLDGLLNYNMQVKAQLDAMANQIAIKKSSGLIKGRA